MATQTKTKQTLVARKLEIENEHAADDSRKWWGAALAISAVLFLLGAYIAHTHTLTGLNLSLFRMINNWPNGLRVFFLVVIVSSNSLWIAIAALVMTSLLKFYQLTWQLAAATITAAGLGFVAKAVIAQPRPYKLVSSLHMRTLETDGSYPSGHVLIVTVIIATLWPYLPRGWRWLIAGVIPLMAIARIYLGVHTPIDVIGGFALSLAVVSAMRLLPEPLRKKLRFD